MNILVVGSELKAQFWLLYRDDATTLLAQDIEEAAFIAKQYEPPVLVMKEEYQDFWAGNLISHFRKNLITTPILVLLRKPIKMHVDVPIRLLAEGADAVLGSDEQFKELIKVQISALVRRTANSATTGLTAQDLRLDLDSHYCEFAGVPVHLTNIEFKMLELLMLRRGQTVRKEVFYEYVYEGRGEPDSKIIDVYICKLRKKIPGDYIRTIWGKGYRIPTDAEFDKEAAM